MEPLTVFYEDRPDVMASLTLAAFRTQSNQKTKIRLIRVAGRLTDESLVALYQTSRGYSAASFSIVDFSAVTEFAVSSAFIQHLAKSETGTRRRHKPFLYCRPAITCLRLMSHVPDPERGQIATTGDRTHPRRSVRGNGN
jgi:hypothetical protein